MERYIIISEVGKGGTATVYKAYDRKNHRLVAIKCSGERMPLLKEYHFLKKMNYCGIPKVYDFFVQGDIYMLVMEFISGNTLENMLEDKNAGGHEMISILINVCKIISCLHEREKVLYLDLKPANIIINLKNVYLIDYGSIQYCANLAEGSSVTIYGTPKYAATEQINPSDMVSEYTDIYQIGCVLKEIVQKTDMKNKDIRRIIKRCERKIATKRYACVREIIAFLCDVVQYEGIVYRKKVQ